MSQLSVKAKYHSESQKLHTTLGVSVDDLRLKVAFTDRTLKGGSDLNDAELIVERPGHFIVEHHLNHHHTRFQFHNSATVASTPVRLTFVHHHGPSVTSLEGAATIDHRNKATIKHNFAHKLPLVKYEYKSGRTTIEPHYDLHHESWGFAVKQRVSFDDHVKLSYHHKDRKAELELVKHSEDGHGPYKAILHFHVENGSRKPHLMLEKQWNFDL